MNNELKWGHKRRTWRILFVIGLLAVVDLFVLWLTGLPDKPRVNPFAFWGAMSGCGLICVVGLVGWRSSGGRRRDPETGAACPVRSGPPGGANGAETKRERELV